MVTSPESEARIRRSPSGVVSERICVSGVMSSNSDRMIWSLVREASKLAMTWVSWRNCRPVRPRSTASSLPRCSERRTTPARLSPSLARSALCGKRWLTANTNICPSAPSWIGIPKSREHDECHTYGGQRTAAYLVKDHRHVSSEAHGKWKCGGNKKFGTSTKEFDLVFAMEAV